MVIILTFTQSSRSSKVITFLSDNNRQQQQQQQQPQQRWSSISTVMKYDVNEFQLEH